MKQKENIEHHTHHHYPNNWGKLILQVVGGFLVFILVANMFGAITSKMSEKRAIHYNCVSACKQKHFVGVKEGFDSFSKNCYVEEFDRTECIKDCNDLLLELKRD